MCRSDYVSFVIALSMMCVVQETVAQVQSGAAAQWSPAEINQLQTQAQAGDPNAQVNLGLAYEKGNGVPQSDRQALKWYKAAADQGDAVGQDDVGLMYRLGRGVEQDKAEAVKWYRKAARQENPNAMFNLGTAYYNGDGVGVDDVAAYAWFLLAQKFGSLPAVDATKRMKEEARTLESEAFEKIGDIYYKGDDLPGNSNEAVNWYRKAAENGAPRMQVKLADLLLQDKSANANYEEVHHLCERAAREHFSAGAYCMGRLYDQGLGVDRDPSKAAKWFSDAAEMGLAAGALRVGQMYWKGEGLKQDRISAYEFIYLASTSELSEAKLEKERLEKDLTPKEVEKGKAKAVEWSRRHQLLVLKGRRSAAN